MDMNALCPDFSVGGGEGEKVDGAQQPARMELEQLRRRGAELETQLGLRKKRGLCFTVSVPLQYIVYYTHPILGGVEVDLTDLQLHILWKRVHANPYTSPSLTLKL